MHRHAGITASRMPDVPYRAKSTACRISQLYPADLFNEV
jgi:hypothetical protein